MREISPWGRAPKYLICDNDNIFGQSFFDTAEGMGTEIIQTPFYTPQANGHCERLIGSIKRECVDHMLILNEKQLRRVMKEYSAYYNAERPHQPTDSECLQRESCSGNERGKIDCHAISEWTAS